MNWLQKFFVVFGVLCVASPFVMHYMGKLLKRRRMEAMYKPKRRLTNKAEQEELFL